MSATRRFAGKCLLCGIGIAALIGCGKPKDNIAAATESPQTAPPADASAHGVVNLGANAPELRQMTIEAVRSADIPADQVTSPARIEANPNRIGHAVLPVPGRIVRVMVKLGDAVQKGQPLVTIDSPVTAEAESAYMQAEASLRQAELAAAKADADLTRLSDLLEHQAVAQKEVLSARTQAELAKSGVEQAKSSREQARRRLELLGLSPGRFEQTITVTAPLSGKVLEIGIVEGEFRNEINVPMIKIADLSRVWATSEVPESKIRYCKVGGSAELELIAYPNETFRGRVSLIADTVNSETRTIKVSAELDNRDGRLRPEMFGRLRYADGLVASVWVPSSAIVRMGDKDYVFVEDSPGKFQSTAVVLGQPHDGGFAVLQGVKAGTRVVTQGSVYLKALL